MTWHATLSLNHRREGPRTTVRYEHSGPLRILKSLYPEGEAICHNVIVHPPGGLVGGDLLDIRVHVDDGAHALISTPGATRFYESTELLTEQRVTLDLAVGARLEWLPLEALAYPGCRALNRLKATLAPGAEMLAWDVTALGLPASDQAFDRGHITQRLELPGLWLEQSHIDAADHRLLASPLGLAGQRCLGTLMFAAGTPMDRTRREWLLEAVREALADLPPDVKAGATCPNPNLLVVRAVAPLVEPLMTTLQRCWAGLRQAAWNIKPVPPRIWQV